MKTNLPSHHLMRTYEVNLHYKRPLFSSMKSISSAEDADSILRSYLSPELLDVKEFFLVLLLTNANCVLGIATIGIGNTSGVLVNVREIAQLALLTHTSHIIVAHNHPSGKLTPSKKDQQITRKIKRGLALFDVTLLDHLILTSESYLSFSNEGLL